MPHISIKTGFTDLDGREEELSEYLCDYPGCPNFATQILGRLVEARTMAAVCDTHSGGSQRRNSATE